MKNFEKIIAVQNYGISGTTLIQSLLDNHPQIISLPMLYGEALYRTWETIILDSAKNNIAHIEYILTRDMPFLFNVNIEADASLTQMGEALNERIEVKEKEFFLYFKEILEPEINRKNFIIAVYLAYNRCYGNHFESDAFICFPIHSQDKKYAKYLLEDFRVVYFLHMIREPIQNMGSLMKHMNYGPIKASLFRSLVVCAVQQIVFEKMYHWGGCVLQHGKKPYFADFSDAKNQVQSRAVKLEDVHLDIKLTLQKIIDWVGLEWNDNLMKSTFMGKLWHNRAESIRVSGINKQTISQKHNEYLTSFDKLRLRLLTHSEQSYFKYKKFSLLDSFFFVLLPFLSILPFKADFNLKRFRHRIEVLEGLHLQKNSDLAFEKFITNIKNQRLKKILSTQIAFISEWVLFDIMTNAKIYSQMPPLSQKVRNKKSYYKLLLIGLPFFLTRMIANYFFLRFLILKRWVSSMQAEDYSKKYIKMIGQ